MPTAWFQNHGKILNETIANCFKEANLSKYDDEIEMLEFMLSTDDDDIIHQQKRHYCWGSSEDGKIETTEREECDDETASC